MCVNLSLARYEYEGEVWNINLGRGTCWDLHYITPLLWTNTIKYFMKPIHVKHFLRELI